MLQFVNKRYPDKLKKQQTALSGRGHWSYPHTFFLTSTFHLRKRKMLFVIGKLFYLFLRRTFLLLFCFVLFLVSFFFCQGKGRTGIVQWWKPQALTSKKQVMKFLCASEKEVSAHKTMLPSKWDNPSTQNSIWHPKLNKQWLLSVTTAIAADNVMVNIMTKTTLSSFKTFTASQWNHLYPGRNSCNVWQRGDYR